MTRTVTAPEERFWPKVNRQGAPSAYRPDLGRCWTWVACVDTNGYGLFFLGRVDGKKKSVKAHRFAYELLVGPIPAGLQMDHLCRVHECVNPAHLEPVTALENARRGIGGVVARLRQTSKTICLRGHRFDDQNTYIDKLGQRKCMKCNLIRSREWRASKRRQLSLSQLKDTA